MAIHSLDVTIPNISSPVALNAPVDSQATLMVQILSGATQVWVGGPDLTSSNCFIVEVPVAPSSAQFYLGPNEVLYAGLSSGSVDARTLLIPQAA